MPAHPRPAQSRLAAALVVAALLAHSPQLIAQRSGSGSKLASPVADDGVAWSTLTRAQQQALAPLARDWTVISASQQRKWLELAARLPAMPQDEQQRVQQRMTEWAHMTPQERGRARLQFQQARNLPEQERKAKWDAYMALTPQQRGALADKRDAATLTRRANAAGAVNSSETLAGKAQRNTNYQAAKAIAPAVVQPRPGATTTLISNAPATARAVGPDEVKALGARGRVNQSTLLPPAPAGSSANRSR